MPPGWADSEEDESDSLPVKTDNGHNIAPSFSQIQTADNKLGCIGYPNTDRGA
jgi:hypothetical protein